jgi:molybdopterin/thiamine biosynthesis adenylyltransferase
MKYYNPELLTFSNQEESKQVLKKKYASYEAIDIFRDLLFENYLINDPALYFAPPDVQKEKFSSFYKKNQDEGVWIVHPWQKKIYHLLSEEKYFLLRTVRNRNLVTKEDQLRLRKKKIAVAGLSVGSNIVFSLARYGIGSAFHIADADVVAVSNMNRTTYGLDDFQKSKLDVAVRTLHQIDPFLEIHAFPEGVTKENLSDFVSGVDLIVDAFDNFQLKIQLRKEAKKKNIPVVSGFDIERGVLLIVERYDQETNLNLDFFLNKHTEEEILKPAVHVEEKTQLFIDIIGKEYHSQKMLHSVLSVGKELTGYPQLNIATMLAASLFTGAIEDILLERVKHSFRKYVSVSTES